MLLGEIEGYKWQIAKDLEIIRIDVPRIAKIEQELHIHIVSIGYINPDKEETRICCSNQNHMLMIARNPSFMLKSILVSHGIKRTEGVVLQITGVMDDNGRILIKTKGKSRVLTIEQKSKLLAGLAKSRLNKVKK